MAEANLGQIELQIVPNECSTQGGSSFVIISNQVLPAPGDGTYRVHFGDYGTCEAYPLETRSIQGRGKIPRARRHGTHEITVIVDYINTIGQCTLKYKDEVAELFAQFCHEASQSLDGSNADISSRYGSDGRGSYIKKFERVPIDMPMLLYLCHEMAKKGNGKFFSALKRLGFMGKVLENRCEYFEDFETTAQKHGHNELAKAIETSRKLTFHPVVKTLTFGNLIRSIRGEIPSSTNFETGPFYLIEPQNDVVLIINIQRFAGTTDGGVELVERRGSNANVRRLEDAVRAFGYTNVEKHENLEAAEIRDVVNNIAHKINENSSSFVCFIGTHGDKGKIYGSDSKSIDVKQLTDAFKQDNCPGLTGKPKLFFIQACGIHHDDGGLEYDYLNDSDFRSRLDPAEPHFLIGISLAPENVSFKNGEDGTWITDVFVKTFQNHYKKQDILSMLLKVNKDASAEHAKNGYKQPCQLVFTTTKIVKFSSTDGSDVRKDLKSDETEKQNKKDRDDEFWSYPIRKQDNVAVIINVESFRKKNGEISEFNDREGSGKDAKKLKQLWEDLGFAVEFDKDLESENIVKFLEKVRAKIEKKNNSSCFVCCIMTHGRMGKLYGSDVAPVDINAIVDLFKESNCPALAGKPKMFFIQACREHPDLKEMVPLQQANPHEIDFFIGYSTLPGNPSQRDLENGTFYVNALVEIFQKYHKDENLLSMMTRVNNKLAENEQCQQCPTCVVSLTKNVYLPSNA